MKVSEGNLEYSINLWVEKAFLWRTSSPQTVKGLTSQQDSVKPSVWGIAPGES